MAGGYVGAGQLTGGSRGAVCLTGGWERGLANK